MAQRVSSPDLVGRREELAALDAALERAAAGAPAFVFVAGESGVGKSRLAGELELRAQAGGARVLVGHCLELGGAEIPYAPLVDALRVIARGDEGAGIAGTLSPPTRAALAELLPELGDGPGPASGERVGQGRVFEALLVLLERLAADEPLVLVLEDLHWADPSTRDFLTYLVRSARRARLLVVLTYRSDELHRRHPLRPLLAELERTPGVERLELARFTEAEAADQLRGILDAEPDPALVSRLFCRSHGNPLYTEELLAASDDGRDELPASLADALLMRVERLTPAGQEVVRVAAVIDRPVHHELLAEVVALAPEELPAAARDAIAHQVLVIDRAGHYAFRHALVGEAVYGDLLPAERTVLHDRVGEAIGRRPELLGEDVSELVVATEQACHFASAHDQPKALAAAVRAGLAAERVFAHSEALRQFDRALTLWDRVPDAGARAGRGRPDLLLHASLAAVSGGEYGRAVAYARQGLAEVDRTADPSGAAALLEQLGHALHGTGDDDGATAAWDEGFALLPAGRPHIMRVRLIEMRARNLMVRGHHEEAVRLARKAAEGARALGAALEEARALCSLGPALAGLGEPDQGLVALARARELAAACNALNDEARIINNTSDILDLSGRTADGLRTIDEGLASLRERAAERSSFDAFLALQGVWQAMRLGRLDEAERRLPDIGGVDEGVTRVYLMLAQATLALLRGELDRVAPHLEFVSRSMLARTEPQWAAPLGVAEAHFALQGGRPEEARDAVTRGLERLGGVKEQIRIMPLLWLGVRAEAELAARGGAADLALAEERWQRLDALGGHPRLYPEGHAYVVLGRAERARLLAEPEMDGFLDAAARFDALGLPWPAAYARLRAAEALVQRGDREAARDVARAAHAWASAAGAGPLAVECELLARRARLDLGAPAAEERAADEPGAGGAGELGLTPRETEVLVLVAEGRTNREIGAALYMSEKTASVHVSRILAKLGVRSRVQAAGVAHRVGLGTGAAAH